MVNRRITRRSGSFTFPSCNPVVSWLLLGSPIQASAAQVQAFQAVLQSSNIDGSNPDYVVPNIRPIQPIGTRTVARYTNGLSALTCFLVV